MEERYQIQERIGQGGLGTVYRGYDSKMKRVVAIKRILTSSDDPSLSEEATKQLNVEAGALASLQHPHIVTIFDVGSDDKGPYVVMELISGRTLDEIVEDGPVTWHDFREIAMQSLEALIAAQEINMIHSDLKPPNIMLSWLPSGKFQVKIVDFGLAVLAQNQSKEEIEKMEEVFGSIFFMPPEQFEREVLDARSDLYSLGCVFYQALAGNYPFQGESGTEVMDAHLNHYVTHLKELRDDLPEWACEWVMWHINRDRADRPQTAREALANFIQNDKHTSAAAAAAATAGTRRPRLIIPGQMPSAPAGTATGQEVATSRQTTPQPLVPMDGSKPNVHVPEPPAVAAEQAGVEPTPPAAESPVEEVPAAGTPGDEQPVAGTDAEEVPDPSSWKDKLIAKWSGMTKPMKIGAAAGLAAGLVLMLSLVGGGGDEPSSEVFETLVVKAAAAGASELPVDRLQLQALFRGITTTTDPQKREAGYRALILAKATDNTHVDRSISEFAMTHGTPRKVKIQLLGKVLKEREDPSIVLQLLVFAKTTEDVDLAVAAYEAVRPMVGGDHLDKFLTVISSANAPKLIRAAEENLSEIIRRSYNRDRAAGRIRSTRLRTEDPAARRALDRLLEACEAGKS